MKSPFNRAARWDGVIPLIRPERLPEPDDLRQILAYIKKHRTSTASFDLVNIGWTTGKNRTKDAEKVAAYQKAGITWWLESLFTKRDTPEGMVQRIRQGPPL